MVFSSVIERPEGIDRGIPTKGCPSVPGNRQSYRQSSVFCWAEDCRVGLPVSLLLGDHPAIRQFPLPRTAVSNPAVHPAVPAVLPPGSFIPSHPERP